MNNTNNTTLTSADYFKALEFTRYASLTSKEVKTLTNTIQPFAIVEDSEHIDIFLMGYYSGGMSLGEGYTVEEIKDIEPSAIFYNLN